MAGHPFGLKHGNGVFGTGSTRVPEMRIRGLRYLLIIGKRAATFAMAGFHKVIRNRFAAYRADDRLPFFLGGNANPHPLVRERSSSGQKNFIYEGFVHLKLVK